MTRMTKERREQIRAEEERAALERHGLAPATTTTRIEMDVGLTKPRVLEFEKGDVIGRFPFRATVEELSYTLKGTPHRALLEAFMSTVWDGIEAARRAQATKYTSPGGIPREKSKFDLREDNARLEAYVAVLDHAFGWRGEWGSTPSAVRWELERRAQVAP